MAASQEADPRLRTPTQPRWLQSWRVSLPLLAAAAAFAFLMRHAATLLRDGDTLWHVAAGDWILAHRAVPASDPFSHTMPGAPWTAHEWLSEVLLAAAHAAGGWTLVAALAAAAFALAVGLLTRALLRWLEPVHALLFAMLALALSAGHVLARPHVLAMPLLVAWTVALVRSRDERRAPPAMAAFLMAAWANMHGGFTFGLALACAFALEAVLEVRGDRRAAAQAARNWGAFLLLSLLAAMATPHGPQGLLFTWQIMVEGKYALQFINEWRSPDFHVFQPFEVWLLAGLAVVLHQGLRLPPMRLLLLLGLLHLALKHARNIELLGLVAPLLFAAPFAQQWRERLAGRPQAALLDRAFAQLARPAGPAGAAACVALLALLPVLHARDGGLQLPANTAPVAAVDAARRHGATGKVLNEYDWGGYLVHAGIAPFIDGRADMYGDRFLREYIEAVRLVEADRLPALLARYDVQWTLLRPGTPAIALLDRLPGWRRVHTDRLAVVHVRGTAGTER